MIIPPLMGKWLGDYSYHKYQGRPAGRIVAFLIDIREPEPNFKGLGVDYDMLDIYDVPATIEGTFKDEKISFVKRYPSLFALDEFERPVSYPGLPSQVIHFNGRICKKVEPDRIFFMGEWHMVHIMLTGSGRRHEVRTDGLWSMKRSLPLPVTI